MENILEDIDIKKLVEDIKSGEAARREATWTAWCQERSLGRSYTYSGRSGFYPDQYEGHMTKLYTLRAWLRGRIHRKNPPENIRAYNRDMVASGASPIQWDMKQHNWEIAEEMSRRYELPEEAAA